MKFTSGGILRVFSLPSSRPTNRFWEMESQCRQIACEGYVLLHTLSNFRSVSLVCTQHSNAPTESKVGGYSFSHGIFIFVKYASTRDATFISPLSMNIAPFFSSYIKSRTPWTIPVNYSISLGGLAIVSAAFLSS